MKYCWHCKSEFEEYTRVSSDPTGNYCPICKTFQKNDSQLEAENRSPVKHLPEHTRNRLINTVEDLFAPISRLVSVQIEIEKLPDMGELAVIRTMIDEEQANLAKSYEKLAELVGVHG